MNLESLSDTIEALYERKCRSPVCWDEVGERRILGPTIVERTNEKIDVI